MKEAIASSACVNASLDYYGGIVTQVPSAQLHLPLEDQAHTLLYFHSKPLTGSQLARSIPETEAFALIDTVLRVPNLTLRTSEFCLFVDHANLIYMFDPKGRDQSTTPHMR
ncbi:hypothetical protein THRCLA_23431 [Thraustotheca clavata]|uniref:Reverse transcriptase RNase H-like domain-containing protein n=1 Tax=Thraustotheca clavata TaxID=74557 RepID=A0A1V9Y5G9_9STRA|nr:hypothetical protein THRCLA_23431 [Thraustotheca clavata]